MNMFDHLTAEERLALRDTLSRGANSASKVTLTLGDVVIRTMRCSDESAFIWNARDRFRDMAEEIRGLAFPELLIP